MHLICQNLGHDFAALRGTDRVCVRCACSEALERQMYRHRSGLAFLNKAPKPSLKAIT